MIRLSERVRPGLVDPGWPDDPPEVPIPRGAAGRRVLAINLGIAAQLFRTYARSPMTPGEVVDVLNAASVRYFVAGAHAAGVWANRPRATLDVDVLVAARHVRTAIQALGDAFPFLTLMDTPFVARFKDSTSNQIVLDVMKPNQTLFRVAMRHVEFVEVEGRQFPLPTVEFMLAMKFAAMVGTLRTDLKKVQDAVDFAYIARANLKLKPHKLQSLGELVYPGGGSELASLVGKARRGERLEI
jgi:hypothetical protein